MTKQPKTMPAGADHVCIVRLPRRPGDARGILVDMIVFGAAVVRTGAEPRKRKAKR